MGTFSILTVRVTISTFNEKKERTFLILVGIKTLFQKCSDLEVLELSCISTRLSNDDANDRMTQTAENLKILTLNLKLWDQHNADICNACPNLDFLKLYQLSTKPIEMPKLETLKLLGNPNYEHDWDRHFPNLKRFCWVGLIHDKVEKLDFLSTSNISEVEFTMDCVDPDVSIPKLKKLTFYEDPQTSIVDWPRKWSLSDFGKFIQRHCETLQVLHCFCDMPQEFRQVIAKNCGKLEEIYIDDCPKNWTEFCKYRRCSGNIGQRLKIITDASIHYEVLTEANACTFGKSYAIEIGQFALPKSYDYEYMMRYDSI